MRRSRGYVPATLAGRARAAAAGGRRRAEVDVRARPRRPRVGRPPHRRPAQLRDAALLHRRRRALRAAVRGRRPSSSPTTCTRSTSRPSTRSTSTCPAVARPAPPRAPRRRASPSTASSARRARSTTAPATAPTAPSGAASSCAATCSASSASAHLWPVRMPGGEAAIREPWRMACAWLLEIGRDVPAEWEQVAQLARTGLASPLTTSMGRLFDAVAALCGIRDTVTYEGQAAIELEAARRPATNAPPTRLHTPCIPGTGPGMQAACRLHACSMRGRRSRRSWTTSRAAWRSRSSPRASTTRSPGRRPRRSRTSRSSSSPAACSRTRCCSSARSSSLPRALVPRRAPAQRRRDRLRPGGGGVRHPASRHGIGELRLRAEGRRVAAQVAALGHRDRQIRQVQAPRKAHGRQAGMQLAIGEYVHGPRSSQVEPGPRGSQPRDRGTTSPVSYAVMTAWVRSRRPSFDQHAADVRLDGLLAHHEPRRDLGDHASRVEEVLGADVPDAGSRWPRRSGDSLTYASTTPKTSVSSPAASLEPPTTGCVWRHVRRRLDAGARAVPLGLSSTSPSRRVSRR